MDKRKIKGQILKDQALTNLEIIYDELFDLDSGWAEEIEKRKSQNDTTKIINKYEPQRIEPESQFKESPFEKICYREDCKHCENHHCKSEAVTKFKNQCGMYENNYKYFEER